VVLTERGLKAALGELASRSPVPVDIEGDLRACLPPAQEAALYFVASEALTNVAKHAQARSARIALQRRAGWTEIVITDDGIGGAAGSVGSGLRGLADRLDALGGHLTVESAPGAGTTIQAAVPVRGA
jgi:signal transduction histidine kinase